MKITAYIRCSTSKQDEASQRQLINAELEKLKCTSCEWVTDTASGGTAWQSRGLASALDASGDGDTIIVSEVSRIARSTIGVLSFLQAASAKNVHIIAVKTGINLDGSMQSNIVVTVLGMAAEIERDLLRARTKAALAARKQRGLPVGRQVGATGRNNKLDGKWQEIEKLLNAKVSKSAIARIIGVSRMTLHVYIISKYAEKVAAAKQSDLPI